LKFEIASCWKVSWNVDPLPLSVPLSAAAELLLDEAPLEEEELLLGEDEVLLDEEQAPRVSASPTTATPAVVTCCLDRSCIFSTPFSGRNEPSLGRPVSL
jgi:hypothetical protein